MACSKLTPNRRRPLEARDLPAQGSQSPQNVLLDVAATQLVRHCKVRIAEGGSCGCK
jgi:hypothetical protein